ncbi:MAG: hypothetical protein IJZ85_01730 [Lachnospiraceae bacterium]|nr:hypothetical protein [Lachnospiraceae bacterium]
MIWIYADENSGDRSERMPEFFDQQMTWMAVTAEGDEHVDECHDLNS